MQVLFAEHRPEIVAHAAAHKHAPIVGRHQDERGGSDLRCPFAMKPFPVRWNVMIQSSVWQAAEAEGLDLSGPCHAQL